MCSPGQQWPWHVAGSKECDGSVAVSKYMGRVEGDTYVGDERNVPEWNTIMTFAKRLENVGLGTEGRMKWKTIG